MRTNLNLSLELIAELRKSQLNWSAVCEQALWAALRGDTQLADLKEENDLLRSKLDAIKHIVD